MRWYGSDEDPFSKVGYTRLIVVRHNASYNFRGQLDNCTQIISVQSFPIGFVCPEIAKSRYGSGPAPGWIEEEIHNSCEHQVNHLFKSYPNGIYELVGDVYHWSSTSYEGEWDGETEIRDSAIRQVSFDHAMYLDCENMYDEMSNLIPHSENREKYYQSETDIHPYMTKHKILVNHANALNILISGYGDRTNFKDSKIPDLENCIHMLMMQIDSEKQTMQPKALEIDEKVRDCLKSHSALMEDE